MRAAHIASKPPDTGLPSCGGSPRRKSPLPERTSIGGFRKREWHDQLGSKMIGIDTNILLRWLLDDSVAEDAPHQAALVSKLIVESKETFFVNHVVIAEAVWVLRHRAGQPKKAIAEILNRLLNSFNVKVDR